MAIGDSGITGEGATQERSDWGRCSWATGDAPEVTSVYVRMTELDPQTEGNVANTGVASGHSAALGVRRGRHSTRSRGPDWS